LLSQPIANKSKTLLNFLKPSEREDWPSAVGAIDLDMHDLPHESSQTEWWYYNTHFQDADGNDYSAFAAFFRVVKHTDKDTGKKSYAHALNWAITDVTNKKYVQEVVLDKDSPASKRAL
jgi:predicted secreted hydrolase